MEGRKTLQKLTPILLLVILGLTASSYQTETGFPGEGEPPEVDYESEVIYDLQASWIFESREEPGLTGPGIYYGSQLVIRSDDDEDDQQFFPDEGEEGVGNQLTQRYLEDEHSGWGEGEPEEVEIQEDDWFITEGGGQGHPTLVTPPHPNSPEASCGTGQIDHQNEYDAVECPEDHGLPDTSESGVTVTENMEDITLGPDGGPASVDYDIDMEVQGIEGSFSENIQGSTSGGTIRYDFLDDGGSWTKEANFFIPEGTDDEIWAVYPETSYESLGVNSQVTNHYIGAGDTEDRISYEGSSGTVNTECTGENSGSDNCETVETYEDVCATEGNQVSTTIETITPHYELNDQDLERDTSNVDNFELESTGSYEYEDVDSSTNEIEVEVTRDRAENEGKELEKCNEPGHSVQDVEEVSCIDEDGCEETGEMTYVEPENAEINEDYSTATYDIEFEQVEMAEQKVFDLNPDENSNDNTPVRTALFEGIDFKDDGNSYSGSSDSGESDGGEVNYLVEDGTPYFSYEIDTDSQGNSFAVGLSTFSIDVDGTDFVSSRESFESYNADGLIGLGDGFVAIEHDVEEDERGEESKGDDWSIAGTSDFFADSETGDSENFVSESDIKDMMEDEGMECSGSSIYCVTYIDLYLDNLYDWDSTDPSTGLDFNYYPDNPDGTRGTWESMGVCELFRKLSGEDLDDASDQCRYEFDRGSDDDPKQCQKEANRRMHIMEGPIVDEEAMQDTDVDAVKDHREACVEHSECVLHGENVSEGTVANVAHENFDGYPGYEEGGDSPDWEVCLNINDREEYAQQDNSSLGGQWYDLDDPVVEEYLRGEKDYSEGERRGLEEALVEDADPEQFDPDPENGRDHIENYWLENPNPQHDTYNPMGGMEGTSLLADCGPLLDCAADQGEPRGGINDETGFFSFFIEHSRDKDYHPQGLDEETEIEPQFEGILNKITKYPENNQLSPGTRDFEAYFGEEEYQDFLDGENDDYEWYYDTQVEEDEAVQYAYTENESWVVDTTGVPYPPFGQSGPSASYASSNLGVHYRESFGGTPRSDSEDPQTQKTDRAFGNSLAVEATNDIPGTDIEEGQGFWIDPDNVRYHWEEGHIEGTGGASTWRELVNFEIDITGPDSGLGWDWTYDEYESGGDPDDIEFEDSGQVVYTDIAWEKDSQGNLQDGLEPPMCGDDRYEFLIEEIGQSENSERYSGRYACSTRPDVCFYDGEFYPSVHSSDGGYPESYETTNDPGQDEGRLKEDEAVCAQRPEDDVAKWYDQDYSRTIQGEQLCRENNLYGSSGVRWFDNEYIEQHPNAVTGGIDDSWNPRLEQRNDPYLISDPESGELNETHTPVPTGTGDDRVALPTDGDGNPDHSSYGFCGGDDQGEQIVTQESNTDLIDTDRNVMGVATSTDYCVLDGEEIDYTVEDDGSYDFDPSEERALYEQGTELQLQEPDSAIACFDGQWFDGGPVVATENHVEVPFDSQRSTTFYLINVEDTERTFEVEMVDNRNDDPEIYTHSEFVDHSGSNFETTVGPQESETITVVMTGADERIEDSELEIEAGTVDGDVFGSDSVTVDVVDEVEDEGVVEGEPEAVPGIGILQTLFIVALATLTFFIQS